jgi:ribosomal protein L21E
MLTGAFSMPYKIYHGKTGVIYNVSKSAVGVIIYKKVWGRYIEKRINVRIEHNNASGSRGSWGPKNHPNHSPDYP